MITKTKITTKTKTILIINCKSLNEADITAMLRSEKLQYSVTYPAGSSRSVIEVILKK